ncbi:MAG: ferredoxin [Ruthenibacterium sp.]
MYATVTDTCIGCGLCAGTCPTVFTMGDGLAHATEAPVPEPVLDCAQKARDDCPVSAINLTAD